MSGEPYATDRTVDIVVPVEVARKFFAEQLKTPLAQRPNYPLTFADGDLVGADLGYWRIVGVSTVRNDAGYYQAVATMQEVLR